MLNRYELGNIWKKKAYEDLQAERSSNETNDYYRKINQAAAFPAAIPFQSALNVVNDEGQWSDFTTEALALQEKMQRVMNKARALEVMNFLQGGGEEINRANIYLLNDSWKGAELALRSRFKTHTTPESVYLFLVKYLEDTYGTNYVKTADQIWKNGEGRIPAVGIAVPDANPAEIPIQAATLAMDDGDDEGYATTQEEQPAIPPARLEAEKAAQKRRERVQKKRDLGGPFTKGWIVPGYATTQEEQPAIPPARLEAEKAAQKRRERVQKKRDLGGPFTKGWIGPSTKPLDEVTNMVYDGGYNAALDEAINGYDAGYNAALEEMDVEQDQQKRTAEKRKAEASLSEDDIPTSEDVDIPTSEAAVILATAKALVQKARLARKRVRELVVQKGILRKEYKSTKKVEEKIEEEIGLLNDINNLIKENETLLLKPPKNVKKNEKRQNAKDAAKFVVEDPDRKNRARGKIFDLLRKAPMRKIFDHREAAAKEAEELRKAQQDNEEEKRLLIEALSNPNNEDRVLNIAYSDALRRAGSPLESQQIRDLYKHTMNLKGEERRQKNRALSDKLNSFYDHKPKVVESKSKLQFPVTQRPTAYMEQLRDDNFVLSHAKAYKQWEKKKPENAALEELYQDRDKRLKLLDTGAQAAQEEYSRATQKAIDSLNAASNAKSNEEMKRHQDNAARNQKIANKAQTKMAELQEEMTILEDEQIASDDIALLEDEIGPFTKGWIGPSTKRVRASTPIPPVSTPILPVASTPILPDDIAPFSIGPFTKKVRASTPIPPVGRASTPILPVGRASTPKKRIYADQRMVQDGVDKILSNKRKKIKNPDGSFAKDVGKSSGLKARSGGVKGIDLKLAILAGEIKAGNDNPLIKRAYHKLLILQRMQQR